MTSPKLISLAPSILLPLTVKNPFESIAGRNRRVSDPDRLVSGMLFRAKEGLVCASAASAADIWVTVGMRRPRSMARFARRRECAQLKRFRQNRDGASFWECHGHETMNDARKGVLARREGS